MVSLFYLVITAICNPRRVVFGQSMIEMEGISKYYKSGGKLSPVLNGISLSIDTGEFVSIMGPSGSGKSTLASLLGCLASPSAGTYKLAGMDVTKVRGDDLAKLRNRYIGYIFQDFNLIDGMSALENVALPLVYGGYSIKQRRQRAKECLTLVGLGHRVNHRPNQLSGGQKQRVAIARALVNDPKLLFADEPTGALDKRTGREILGVMQRLNSRGHTIVQVTHSLQDANYSKRILHLVDGMIVRDEQVDKPTIGYDTEGESSEASRLHHFWRVFQQLPDPGECDFASLKLFWEKVRGKFDFGGAAAALSRWLNPEVSGMQTWLFEHGSWTVKAEVLRHLPAGAETMGLLLRGLQEDNPWVRTIAMNELRRRPAEIFPATELPRIAALLKDTDERVRSGAATTLGKFSDPSLVDPLVEALGDHDGRVRANAIEALRGHYASPKVMEKIRPLLDDKFNRARANAAVALLHHDPSRAVGTLVQMLRSADNLMRSSAAWGLGAIASPSGAEFLLEALREEKEEVVINQMTRSLALLARKGMPLEEQVRRVMGGIA